MSEVGWVLLGGLTLILAFCVIALCHFVVRLQDRLMRLDAKLAEHLSIHPEYHYDGDG